MNQQLHDLLIAQQTLGKANSPKMVIEAIHANLRLLLPAATSELCYPLESAQIDELSSLTGAAVAQQLPQISDDEQQIALPLIVEDKVNGVLTINAAQQLELHDVAWLTSLAALVALRLDRLTWPAPPQVFRQLVENANVGITVAGRGGNLLYANRATAQLYGYESLERMAGLNSRDLYYHPSEQRVTSELILQSENPGGWIGDVLQKRADGEKLPVRLAVFALRDQHNNKTDTFGAIVQNLSEQQSLLWSLQQQTRRLHAAAEVARATIAQLDLEVLLDQVTTVTQRLFNFEVVTIILVEHDALIAKASYSPTGRRSLSRLHLPLNVTSLNSWVVKNGQGLCINDVSHDSRYHATGEFADTQSELVVPLRLGNTIIGTLDIQSAQRDAFQPEDLETFQGIADQLAVAVDNARLFDAERTRVRQLAVVNEISRLLAAAAYHLDDLWDAIYQQIIGLFDVSTFYVLLYDEPTKMLNFVWLVEDGEVLTSEPPFPLSGLSSHIIRTGEPLLLTDLPAQWKWLRDNDIEPVPILPSHVHRPPRSWLGVPLRGQDSSMLGVMSVQSYETNVFSTTDQQLLMTVATQISLALENSRLFSQLSDAATQLKKRARRLESLHRISTLISSSLDRNVILSRAAEQIVKLLDIDRCWIALFDEKKQTSEFVAEYPLSELINIKMSRSDNSTYRLHQTRDVVIYRDVTTEPSLENVQSMLQARDVRSMMIIRLAAKDKLLGSIGLDSIGKIRDFTEGEIETGRTLAIQVAMAVENADLYSKALAANVLKSQFLATMSHELRTPLNAILGYTEMIIDGTYGAVSDKQRDRLNRVYNNSQSLLALINDVLDLAKIESGKLTLTFESIAVVPLVAEAITSIAPQAEAKKLHLTTEFADTLPLVNADSLRLRQIMINLLGNAVKFTHQGGITVRIAPMMVSDDGSSLVTDRTLAAGDWVVITVEDSGIGIAQDNFELIFDAFRQVDGSSVREYPGTGLGLSITKQLIEMHGGKIWLESQIGVGSTFTVVLPAMAEPPANTLS